MVSEPDGRDVNVWDAMGIYNANGSRANELGNQKRYVMKRAYLDEPNEYAVISNPGPVGLSRLK
jgi:hypothetical protein